MKRLYLLALSLALALTTSCKDDAEKGTDDPQVVSQDVVFTAKLNDYATKASETSFDQGDQISVYATDASGKSQGSNVTYTYSSGLFESSSPIVVAEGEKNSYIAIYPYASSAFQTFSVETDQSSAQAYADSDLMSASVALTDASEVELPFAHCLSKVEFNITSDYVDLSDAQVVVYAQSEVSCNFTTQTFEPSGDTSSIKCASLGDGSFEAIIAPQSIAQDAAFIDIYAGGETFTWFIESDFDIESGYKYVCDVAVNQKEVTFNGDIEPWGDGSSLDGGVDGFSSDGLLYLDLVEATTTDIVVKVDMGDYEGNYYVGLTSMLSYPGDAASLASLLVNYELNYYYTDLAVVDDLTIFDYDNDEISLANVWAIYPGSDYAIVAFGVDASGAITTNVSELFVTTENMDIAGSIDLEAVEIGATSIIVNATPTSEIDKYLVSPVARSVFEGDYYQGNALATANAIVTSLINNGGSLSASSFSGATTIDLADVWPISPSTEYAVFAFGIDSKGYVTSEITVKYITSIAPTPADGELASISVGAVGATSALLSVDSGDYDGIYYVGSMPAANYDKSVDDGGYGQDPQAAAEAFMYLEVNYYGTDLSSVNNYWTFKGDLTDFNIGQSWSLASETEHLVFVFGVLADGTVDGKVLSERFTTHAVGSSDNVVTFEVTDLTETSATVQTTTTNNDPYFVDFIKYNTVKDMTDDELISGIVKSYGSFLSAGIVYGDTEFVWNSTGWIESGTEYVVFAFGYEGGIVTTGLFRSSFTTPGDPGDPDPTIPAATDIVIPDVDFGEMTVSSVTSSALTITCSPTDKQMRYIMFCAEDSYFNSFPSDEDRIVADLTYLEAVGFQYCYSLSEILNILLYQGDDSLSMSSLKSGTTYVSYAYGVELATLNILTKVKAVEVTTGGYATVAPADSGSRAPMISTTTMSKIKSSGFLENCELHYSAPALETPKAKSSTEVKPLPAVTLNAMIQGGEQFERVKGSVLRSPLNK